MELGAPRPGLPFHNFLTAEDHCAPNPLPASISDCRRLSYVNIMSTFNPLTDKKITSKIYGEEVPFCEALSG